jgi:hypothetical protein
MKKTVLLSSVVASSLYAGMVFEWSEEYRSGSEPMIHSVATADNGLIVAVGELDGDTLVVDPATPPAVPDINGFVTVYESNGTEISTDIVGAGTVPDRVVSIMQTGPESFKLLGETVGTLSGTSNGEIDIFLADFNLTDGVSNIVQIGTNGRDYVDSLSMDSIGNLYVTGVTDGNFSNPAGAVIDSNPDNSNYSPFILKLENNGTVIDRYTDYELNSMSHEINTIVRVNETNGTEIYFAYDDNFNSSTEVKVLTPALDVNATYPLGFLNLRGMDFGPADDNGTVPLYVGTNTHLVQLVVENDTVNGGRTIFEEGSQTMVGELQGVSYSPFTNSIVVTRVEANKLFVDQFQSSTSMMQPPYSTFNFGHETDTVDQELKLTSTVTDMNGSIFVTGMMNNFTFGEDNVSGGGTLLANIRETVVSVPLLTGWNLISGNFDINEFPNEIVVAYQYGAFDPANCEFFPGDPTYCKNVWRVGSSNNVLVTQLTSYSDLETISAIENRDGLWVYSTADIELRGADNDMNITTDNYPVGWSLNGIGTEINASLDLFCKPSDFPADENISMKSAWIFDTATDAWLLNTEDDTFMTSLNNFDVIYPNQGFWVNCESNVTLP